MRGVDAVFVPASDGSLDIYTGAQFPTMDRDVAAERLKAHAFETAAGNGGSDDVRKRQQCSIRLVPLSPLARRDWHIRCVRVPSLTDPDATILRLSEVSRRR